jgi:O-antigen ligase
MIKKLNLNFNKKSLPGTLYFILLFIIFILPDFGVIDLVGSQLLFLTILNILSFSYLIFNNDYSHFKKVLESKINIIFLLFLSTCFISLFWSFNINESIIKVSYLLNVYFLFLLSSYFLKSISLNFISLLFVFFLIFHLILLYSIYFEIINNNIFDFSYSNFLRGLAANKNIASSIILFSIPFLIISQSILKTKVYSFFIFILCFFSFYLILALSSRSVFIALILNITVYVLYIIYSYYNTNFFKYHLKTIFSFYIIPFLLSLLLFNSSSLNNTNVSISSRISSIDVSDTSTSNRIRFYKHAVNYIQTSPIIGVGIGNWKFKSIDSDKLNIKGYIVPYHVHNDFLEFFVELGFFGFLFYLALFIYPAILLLKILFFSPIQSSRFLCLMLILVMTSFFVDSNLNFPHARLIQQLFFTICLAFIVNLNIQVNENN